MVCGEIGVFPSLYTEIPQQRDVHSQESKRPHDARGDVVLDGGFQLLKPVLLALVGFVEALVYLGKPLVHLSEALIHLGKPLIHLGKAFIYALFQGIKPLIHLSKLLIYLGEAFIHAPLQHIEARIYLSKPLVNALLQRIEACIYLGKLSIGACAFGIEPGFNVLSLGIEARIGILFLGIEPLFEAVEPLVEAALQGIEVVFGCSGGFRIPQEIGKPLGLLLTEAECSQAFRCFQGVDGHGKGVLVLQTRCYRYDIPYCAKAMKVRAYSF